MPGFLHLSVVNDPTGFFFFVRFETDTIGGFPRHSDHLLDGCSFDDPDYKVIIEYASIFDLEVS